MKRHLYYLILSVFCFSQCNNDQGPKEVNYESDPDEQVWTALFNGKNLEGWLPKIRGHALNNNFGNTFSVKDGYMTVNYDAYDTYEDRFGHIFYKDSFSYYRVKVDYRFIGDQVKEGPGWAIRNSGIMLHCQSPQSMGVDQNFPISIEAQLLGGNGTDPRSTMNLCTPGTNVFMNDSLFTPHCVSSTSETYHGEQWVTAEALVLGDSLVVHYVNGDEVLRYTKPQVGGGAVDGLKEGVKQMGNF